MSDATCPSLTYDDGGKDFVGEDEDRGTVGVDTGGGRKDGLPVKVAVVSVLIHTGAFVTVKVTPGVMETIVFDNIDV
jgi:hypothetical protein